MIKDSPHSIPDDDNNAQHELECYEEIPEISFHAIVRTNHPQIIRDLDKF